MKRLWYKLRALLTDDFEECDTRQLSRKDIRSLLYGSFLICALTILTVCITYNINSAKANEQATKEMQLLPGQNRASVVFGQGRGVVSVHRMKELFCDSCIDKILTAVKNSLMPEYVLLDPVNMTCYSISEGKRIIGGYTFTTAYGSRGYEIDVECENG